MNTENTRRLFDAYPILYQDFDKPVTQSLVAFGFEFGDGWYGIVDKLSEQLEFLNNEPACPWYTIAVQMKEKWGTLSFYTYHERKDDERYSSDTDKMWSNILWDLTDYAERKSADTCEECGSHGTLRNGGWIRTLCDECEANR